MVCNLISISIVNASARARARFQAHMHHHNASPQSCIKYNALSQNTHWLTLCVCVCVLRICNCFSFPICNCTSPAICRVRRDVARSVVVSLHIAVIKDEKIIVETVVITRRRVCARSILSASSARAQSIDYIAQCERCATNCGNWTEEHKIDSTRGELAGAHAHKHIHWIIANDYWNITIVAVAVHICLRRSNGVDETHNKLNWLNVWTVGLCASAYSHIPIPSTHTVQVISHVRCATAMHTVA